MLFNTGRTQSSVLHSAAGNTVQTVRLPWIETSDRSFSNSVRTFPTMQSFALMGTSTRNDNSKISGLSIGRWTMASSPVQIPSGCKPSVTDSPEKRSKHFYANGCACCRILSLPRTGTLDIVISSLSCKSNSRLPRCWIVRLADGSSSRKSSGRISTSGVPNRFS